jgi:GalNAc-alpha-(1->4)-GalNAc-alpha-(1->3)-diNAcBac-PP-undecaprenol alpha-1,4-N-acetyl-D-galactosaminyltransferase
LGGKKNQKDLILAFAGIESRDRWALEFVGDGPDRQVLGDLCERLDLQDSVTFLGQRCDVEELLQDSAIFAFTSLTEGFPNALAEAMAAGCACISYDCPTGPSELINHGASGFLVEAGDESEYSRLLQRLVDEPDLRAQFSSNARESIRRFESSIVLQKLSDMIEDKGVATSHQS